MNGSKISQSKKDRGSVLVEFAMVSLVLYLIFAAILDLGRAVFAAQSLQDAARVIARELSLTALPPEMTLDQALQDDLVRARVFNPDYLVIDLDQIGSEEDLDAFFASLPLGNQALRPLMIFDSPTLGGVRRRLIRYPGALLTAQNLPPETGGFTVGIPRVVARNSKGIEAIRWVPVLEEVKTSPESTGPFPLIGDSPVQGVVTIRLNYPFQAAALSGYQTDEAGPLNANLDDVILARDKSVVELNDAPGGLLPLDNDIGPYAGRYGLGRQLALTEDVRPFRTLLSAQAVFRREVFR